MIAGACLVVVLSADYLSLRTSLREKAFLETEAATHASALEVDRQQRAIASLVDEMAADLTSGALAVGDLEAKLRDELTTHPDLFVLAVAVPPAEGRPLAFPSVRRVVGGYKFEDIAQAYDITQIDWYRDVQERPAPGWHGPFYGPATGHFIAFYCHTWGPPDRPGDSTSVYAAYSLHDLGAVRRALPAGRYGYAWVLSQEARPLSFPDTGWVRTGHTMDQTAQSLGMPQLGEVGRRAIAGEAGRLHMRDPITGADAVLFQEPVPASGWSIVAVLLEREIVAGVPALKRLQVVIATSLLVTLGAGAALAFLRVRP